MDQDVTSIELRNSPAMINCLAIVTEKCEANGTFSAKDWYLAVVTSDTPCFITEGAVYFASLFLMKQSRV